MPCASTERAQLVELAGIAVDVDGDDRPRAVGDRRLDRCGIEVERTPVDVREDGRRALVDRAVRRRDEGVRRGDDLVSGPDAGRDAEQVQPRRAARDGGGVRRSDRARRTPPRSGRSSARARAGPTAARRRRAPPPARRATGCESGIVRDRTPRSTRWRATSRPRRATDPSARCGRAPCRGRPSAARASPARPRSRGRRPTAPARPPSPSRP